MNEQPDGTGGGGRVGARRTGDTPRDPRRRGEEPPPESTEELSRRVHIEQDTLDAELAEIDMLLDQARAEAARHENKRAASAERLGNLQRTGGDLKEIAELSGQVVTLTRRALVMQAQVDVIEGKLKTLGRFRDAVARTARDLDALSTAGDGVAGDEAAGGATRAKSGRRGGTSAGATGAADSDDDGAGSAVVLSPAVSRIVLTAQEDLRRDIARTMHDGPAQSLTNIVLQAQIVERMLARDPASAQPEVRQLISMVQQTLDATKSFIFDVRPMVLDDLGLVPTIRRAARERGRRAQIPVDFESFGADGRLSMELESGLFRILDEVLAAYLGGRPDRVTIRLDWADGPEARITARRAIAPPALPAGGGPNGAGSAAAAAPSSGGRGRGKANAASTAEPEAMPAALAAMIDERRAVETAARRAVGGLNASTRREIVQRASTLGVAIEIVEDGREVVLVVDAAAVE